MKTLFKIILVLVTLIITGYVCFRTAKKVNPNPNHTVGEKLDSLNGVYIFYNGGVDNVEERNTTDDGYNLGLKYQCVEFAKRYYYEHYKHKMPDSYGHAKDFFDVELEDGALNAKRELLQFTNPSYSVPQTGDLLIFGGHAGNPYGHVAIVSEVGKSYIEVIQQNPGPFASSRANYSLNRIGKKYLIEHDRLLGWLRKE